MQNLLPPVHDSIARAPEASRVTHWNASDADPSVAIISKQLQAAFHIDKVAVVKYKDSQPTKDAPNFVSPAVVAAIGPSPLDAVVRSEKNKPHIDISALKLETDEQQRRKELRKLRQKLLPNSVALYINTLSFLPVAQDLYMQFLKSMKVIRLQPRQPFMRLLDGDPKTATYNPSVNSLHLLLAPFSRIAVNMTSRQELRLFSFERDQRIGLEIELVNHRLAVSRVLPNTQAAMLSAGDQTLLKDAILVAVNGTRVINLKEFQNAMRRAKMGKHDEIQLLLAVYKGGKSKVDELYAHDFSRHQRVKSILSNIFSKGIDGDDHINVAIDGSSVGSVESLHEDEEEDEIEEPKADNVIVAKIDISADEDFARSKELQAATKEWTHTLSPRDDFKDNGDDGSYNDDDADSYKVEIDNHGMVARRKVVKRDVHIHTHDHKPAPPKKVQMKLDEASISSEDSSTAGVGNEWNALTAVQHSSIFPYSTLVCLPRELSCSTCWGNPKRYLQLTNFSTSWKLDVAWVDEQGALVPRTEIKGPMGTVHFELVSEDHVWVITAKPNPSMGAFKLGSLSLSLSSSLVGHHASEVKMDASTHQSTVDELLPPLALAFRPCRAAVQEGKCVSLIWTPWVSLSVSQQILAAKKISQQNDSKQPNRQRIQSVMHIQLFETPQAVLQQTIDRLLISREDEHFDEGNDGDGQIKYMLQESQQAGTVSLAEEREAKEKEAETEAEAAKLTRRPLLTSKIMSQMRRK